MIIMGIDPGVTTGVGMVDTDDGGFDHYQFGPPEEIDERYEGMQYGALAQCMFEVATVIIDVEPDCVAIEKFVLRPGTRGFAKEDSVSPLVAGGMLATWLFEIVEYEGDVVWQQASEAKGLFTDQRMKDLGYWVPGNPHATDALRHALLAGRKLMA